MRLLQLQDDGELSLVKFSGNNIPRYAILSHTWGTEAEEVTFQDMTSTSSSSKSKAGFYKIRFCAEQAKHDGLEYCWVDTCCIDKSSSQELSEAINSMFRWYKNAERCYVYLSDVSNCPSQGDGDCTRRWKPAFKKSRWFTRGWTLQELIAPSSVEFYSKEGTCLGNKQSLEQTLCEITGIAVEALRGKPLASFGDEERFLWAKNRMTTCDEDAAYCLLGIFDIQMPLLYAEGREKALKRLRKEIRDHTSDQSLSLNEEQRRMLLDSLRFEQIDARQMTIKSAHAKTCRWLLKSSEYFHWLNAERLEEHHGFLWIKGKPGTGKSTLMKFALTQARKTMKSEIVIAFFFNARGENMEKSTTGTYRSLLLQLLERLPSLQSVLDSFGISVSGISTNYQWSVELLKMLLERAIKLLGESSMFCFIDALDECEEQQIREMIQFFEHVGELAVSAGIGFRVCLSSRHYPHITIRKGLELVLEGQEGHTQDIANYLESELKIGKSKIAQQIRSELQDKASGVFMWVALVVGILNKEHDRGRIHALRRRLQEIPGDLHELFRDILMRDSQNKDELVLCIQWVLFARQPLSPEQLYFAILSEIEPDAVPGWDHDEITEEVIKRFILDSSKGLAEITTSKLRKVQFIHESVRDFLLKEDGLGKLWPDLRTNFQGQSHERLKHCCLTYISTHMAFSLTFIGKFPGSSGTSSIYATHFRKSAPDNSPLLEYAVQNVLHHADVAEGSGIAQGTFLQDFPLERWIQLDNLFEKFEIRRHISKMSLLYLLSEHNMANLIKILPSAHTCLKVEGERYGPPLFAAMATGSKEAVRALLEAFYHEQISENHSHEPYHQYDEGNSKTFGRDFKFSQRRGLLSYLTGLGNEMIFSFALGENIADVDSKDSQYGRTPLLWATIHGHAAIVKLLLDTDKANVNAIDQDKWTPLMHAAREGHEVIVKLLLDTDKVDHDVKSPSGMTPLLLAVQNGQEAVVELLLSNRKINVDVQEYQRMRTPLSLAAQNGHETIVELLLNTGVVEVDSVDLQWQTPLILAAKAGNESIVKQLLDTGEVDVNFRSNYGRSPLWLAARNGHEAIVKLLINASKININLLDLYRQTPLLVAAKNGYESVVKLLLDTGKADVNLTDSYDNTALMWAIKYQDEGIVRLLTPVTLRA